MQYISTNFAYGNGPYLRCIDLGIALNKEFGERNVPEMRMIIPLVYGDRQKKIMQENFGKYIKENPDSIFLDVTYGNFLNDLFFKGNSYRKNLEFLIENQPKIEEKVNDHLNSEFDVENFEGEKIKIKPHELAFEVSHNPRVVTYLEKSFYTTIAFFSEILQRSMDEPSLKLDKKLLKDAKKIAIKIEKNKDLCFMPEPFTFSYDSLRKTKGEIFTPPFIHLPEKNNNRIKKGMYVTITGIKELSKLFERIDEFGMSLYSPPFVNSPHIKQNNFYSSNILSNKDINFHFARSGWSSVWSSHMTLTSLICPKYTKGDDPEIFFNEKSLRKLGIATIFSPDSCPEEILKQTKSQLKNMKELNKKIIKQYGILDGINYTAKIIADFLEEKDLSKYPRSPIL